MDAQSNGNPFDDVEPHSHLSADTKTALWAACELVLNRPGDFADAVAWLNENYSEPAILSRLLQESAGTYRYQIFDLRFRGDRCNTFPRRRALRAGSRNLNPERRLALLRNFWSVPEIGGVSPNFAKELIDHPENVREWVVQLTVEISRSRGRMLRGDQCFISNARQPDDIAVDAGNVEVVWRWLDEQTRQRIREIKDERRERDAKCHEEARDRGGGLRLAVEDAAKTGLPAGRDERMHARRVVMLACLLSFQHELKLPGEFCGWQWENQGFIFADMLPHLGEKQFVPGRESALFNPIYRRGQPSGPGFVRIDLEGFTTLVGCAVRILQRSPNTEKTMIVEDFRRLCEYMSALITQKIPLEVQILWSAEREKGHDPTPEFVLWRETRLLAEKCITHLSEIRRTLDGRGTLTTDRVARLDGVQEALSDLIGSISNPQLPNWTMAPQHSGMPAESGLERFNNDMAALFDEARVTITRFTDWLNSASSELTPVAAKLDGRSAPSKSAMESDPAATAAMEHASGTAHRAPPTDPVERAIADLLTHIPETWAEVDPADFSEPRERALFLLVAAGMVERRSRLRLRMFTHPVSVEATITVTGEYGGVEALQPLAAAIWVEWEGAYTTWREGNTKETVPVHCERLQPDEWRLTSEGMKARQDLTSGTPAVVFDFVLKRGYFAIRGPVRGAGALVKMDKTKADAPAAVNVSNWDEGAKAFAAMFLALQEKTKAASIAPTSTQSTTPAAVPETGELPDAGGPTEDPHDTRKAVWAGKRIYLGNDTQVSRLFWLLAKPVGRAATLAEVQRAVDCMETDRESDPEEVKKAGQRIRKAISELRAALHEAELDAHVVIVKGGSRAAPEYTMVWRFPT